MLDIIQIILSVLIIISILFQQRSTEGGILFGTKSEFFLKRRGFEKKLYYLTWVLIFSFIFVSLLKVI